MATWRLPPIQLPEDDARDLWIEDGARADVLTFEADPRDDRGVLGSPAAVVLGGVRIS